MKNRASFNSRLNICFVNYRMKLSTVFSDFFNSEKSGGIILVGCALVSMLMANSPIGGAYTGFWETNLNGHSLTHWINDGLMSIFFLLIGLELEREIYAGELSDIKNASFPIIAAIGGVLVPAGIYLLITAGTEFQNGAGIPMATDIAFAIGMLALLGKRVPANLKIFITALAVIDDLCAIIVIAVFYSTGFSLLYLGIAMGIFAVLILLNRLKVHNLIPYLIGGIAMWYCMLHSGIHATIAGVLLAFAVPFGDGGKASASYILQHFLHKPVAFFIVPLFALANTAISFEAGWIKGLESSESMGIITGLVLGKPLGILLFTFIAVKIGLSKLPEGIRWKHIAGTGLLAGIGFTMSIFVALLAFDKPAFIATAKIAIIAASVLAACLGLAVLRIILREPVTDEG
jgi:NhaA family Na+:H+ antiporter